MSRLVLSFSGRKDGNCDGIGRCVSGLTGADFIRFADLHAQPCGECDYECLRGGACPKKDGVFRLYDQIAAAEECVFLLPNYADFPCAQFFIFAERGTGWFGGSEEKLARYMAVPKKAIVISGGAEESFRHALSMQADRLEFLFISAKEYGQGSLEGHLAENEAACARARAFLEGKLCT